LLLFLLNAVACKTGDATEAHLYIPTSFTPNGDALNDTWGPAIISGIEVNKYEMNIYNQDFAHVFRSENVSDRWDGRSESGIIQAGSYLFTIDYSASADSGLTFGDYYISGTLDLVL